MQNYKLYLINIFNMINYELLLLIAIFSFVYTNILTQPDQIFSGLYKFLYRFFKTDERNEAGLSAFWLFKIIIHCEKCVAGQLALWFTVFSNWYKIIIDFDSFVVVTILLSITFCILCTITIKGIYNKYINHD